MDDSRGAGKPEPESALVAKKREFLESFFKKGAQFTQELLKENDRLRRQLVQLEDALAARGRPSPSQQTLDELVAKLHALEEEKRQLVDRIAAADEAGMRFVDRYQEIEHENNDLASLFVAQGQLYATLEVSEVVQVATEILLNFVGAHGFAIAVVDREDGLRVLAAEGIGDQLSLGAVVAGPVVEGVLRDKRSHIEEHGGVRPRVAGREPPFVCFPLLVDDRALGILAIWSFLPQKSSLEELDRRIFDLLSLGAARALEGARMASIVRTSLAHQASGTFEEYEALLR